VIAKFGKKKDECIRIGRQNINVDFIDMQHLPELFYAHVLLWNFELIDLF